VHFKNGQLFTNWPSNSQSGKPGYSNAMKKASSVWTDNQTHMKVWNQGSHKCNFKNP